MYVPSIEKGRPVLQGLLAIDFLAREVLGWAQAMPKFAADLVKYVRTFLERTYERCRTAYMEAVLEKQSYMLIGRHDIDKLLRLESASASLPNGQLDNENSANDAQTSEVESELSELFLNLRPIKQENLIRDENKLILLASLSDSLEYVADSIERLGRATVREPNQVEESSKPHHNRSSSASARDLASFANEYRKLAIDCLKVLRVEMQLEMIFHMQEMTSREYLEDQDAEEPDDFIISLTAQLGSMNDKGKAELVRIIGFQRIVFVGCGFICKRKRSKLQSRGDGPFQVLERINDDAYKLDLQGKYNISATFNVSDLTHFDAGSDSRSNPFQQGGNDMIPTTPETLQDAANNLKEPMQLPTGPITRQRVKKIREAFAGLA